MDVTLAVATGFVYWEATPVFWKGYQCVSWEGGELETKSMWTKYLCDNGVSSFLRYISFETQGAAGATGYGKHIILSEAGCEG